MKFETLPYADICTGEIVDPKDPEYDHKINDQLNLLASGPYTFADYDEGCFMWVPVHDSAGEIAEQLLNHGFTKRMVDIFLELKKQGIQYARFDAHGYGINENKTT